MVKGQVEFLKNENMELKRTLGYLSHEMLNILTLVEYNVKQAGARGGGEAYIRQTAEDVDYMIRLLKELSEYNGIEKIKKEKIDISEVAKEVLMEMNEKYGQDIQFNVRGIVDNLRYIVDGDRLQLRQLFINILKNAVEAIENRKYGVIDFFIRKDRRSVIVEVSDNGVGIEPEEIEFVFQEGYTYGKKGGTGLGLAICKKIAEKHEGELEVKSLPGHGTVFKLTIPRYRAAD